MTYELLVFEMTKKNYSNDKKALIRQLFIFLDKTQVEEICTGISQYQYIPLGG